MIDFFSFILTNEDDEPDDVFDFSSPEHVIVELIPDENATKGFTIDECCVIWAANNDVVGAASYDDCYGGFLDYTIKDLVEFPSKEGWFVVENVTGEYYKGDGYTIDDDMRFYYTGVRPATQEEIDMV